jgi:hypothetical protein
MGSFYVGSSRAGNATVDARLSTRAVAAAMVRRLDYFRLPVVASYGWMLAAFLGATAVFHAVLVFARPLGRVGWKVVDYVWLLFGLLGAFSGVQAVRQEIAAGLLPEAEEAERADAAAILERITLGASPAVCRTLEPFEKAPADEETARRQREFDQVCEWFRSAKRRVERGLPAERPLTPESLGGGPVPPAPEFSIVASLEEAVARYNRAQATVERLSREADQSDFEATMTALAPFLIAIALALRITKVTGELRLERRG